MFVLFGLYVSTKYFYLLILCKYTHKRVNVGNKVLEK